MEKTQVIRNRWNNKPIFATKCGSFSLCVQTATILKINLTRADLTRADLTGADLTGANLTGANLTGANLTGANLTGADLTRADLIGANLTRANLTGANLTRADLTGADLTGADLTGACIDFSCLPLWCGSLNMKTDEKQRRQITYHLASLLKHAEDLSDEEQNILKSISEYANKFHHIGEVGRI